MYRLLSSTSGTELSRLLRHIRHCSKVGHQKAISVAALREPSYNSMVEITQNPVALTIERIPPKNGTNGASYMTILNRNSSHDFLLQKPRGSYTSCRTVNRTSIMDLKNHIERTVKSMQTMKFTPKGSEEEPAEVTEALKPFRDVDSMTKILLPLLREGMKRFYEVEENSHEHDETRVTFLASYSFEQACPMIFAHFSPILASSSEPCQVEIFGEPRKAATTKDSQWVRDRDILQETKHPLSNEVLLCDELGHIYEGLSSNFFAVIPDKLSGVPTVVTAPLEYVLRGTIMQIVRDVCIKGGIPYENRFPNIDEIDKWKGAFITSTSRLVLPIEKIVFRDNRSPKFIPTCDTVEYIQREVKRETYRRAFRIL